MPHTERAVRAPRERTADCHTSTLCAGLLWRLPWRYVSTRTVWAALLRLAGGTQPFGVLAQSRIKPCMPPLVSRLLRSRSCSAKQDAMLKSSVIDHVALRAPSPITLPTGRPPRFTQSRCLCVSASQLSTPRVIRVRVQNSTVLVPKPFHQQITGNTVQYAFVCVRLLRVYMYIAPSRFAPNIHRDTSSESIAPTPVSP